MAESHDGFDSIAVINTDNLREVLRRTMVMGLPEEDSQKPTFYFERIVAWDEYDTENNPWEWDQAPIAETQQQPVRPICTYEFFAPLGRQGAHFTEVGDFNPTTLLVTVFEDELAQIWGSSHVEIGPSTLRWYFRYWRPAGGLNDLTIYQVTYNSDLEANLEAAI